MPVRIQTQPQFATYPTRVQPVLIGQVGHESWKDRFVFAVAERVVVDKPAAEITVLPGPAECNLAFQSVNVGQAVIDQVGVVAGGLDVEVQLEVTAKGKLPIAKKIAPRVVRDQVVVGIAALKCHPTAPERVAVAEVQRAGLG